MYPAREPPTPGLRLDRISKTPMGTFLGAPTGPYFAWAPSHVLNLILPFLVLVRAAQGAARREGLRGGGRHAARFGNPVNSI